MRTSRLLVATCTLIVCLCAHAESWQEVLGAEVEPRWSKPADRAFDFWIGEWHMNWRSPTPGALQFGKEGNLMRHRVFPILGGKAIVELAWDASADAQTASGRGFSIRYRRADSGRWVMAQNWPGPGNDGFGFLDQLIGEADNGRLSVYSVARRPRDDGDFDLFHRRYNFADIRDGAFRWDGASTFDSGATWQTWAVVDATRLRPLDAFKDAGSPWPGVHGDLLCPDDPHGRFDQLEGNWSGTVQRASGLAPATLSGARVLDGCAIVTLLREPDAPDTFNAIGYVPRLGQWLIYELDGEPASEHRYLFAAEATASPEEAPEGIAFHGGQSLAIVDEYTQLIAPEAFSTDNALTRRVWRHLSPERVLFEDQVRRGPGEPWEQVARYDLSRLDPS